METTGIKTNLLNFCFIRTNCAMVRRFFFPLSSNEHPPKDRTYPPPDKVTAESADKKKNKSLVDESNANLMESNDRPRHGASTSFDDDSDCIQLEGCHARGLATLAASKALETVAERRRQQQQQQQQQQQKHLDDGHNTASESPPFRSCNEFTMGIFDEGNGTRIRWWRGSQ